jgi:hypothetical protein
LLIAMGTPLYAVFFYVVPGFKSLAAPARILYLLTFCLSILAAFGAEKLGSLHNTQHATRNTQHVRFCLLFAALSLAALAAAVLKYAEFFFHRELSEYEFVQLRWSVVFIGATVLVLGCQVAQRWNAPWGIISVGLIVADLFLFGLSFNPVCDARILDVVPKSIERLRAERSFDRILSFAPPDDPKGFLRWMPPNTPTIYGLFDVQGSDSLVVRRYQEFLRTIQPGAPTHDFRNFHSSLIDLLNVKYVLTEMELDSQRWERVSDDDLPIYRNRNALPRTFLTHRAQVKRNHQEVLQAISQPNFEPEQEVLLEEQPRDPLPADTSTEGDEAKLTEYRPNRALVRAQARRPGVLVFSDTAFAGWRVAVDGQPRPLLRANGALRAVTLSEGEHTISFAYHPTSFRFGAFWSFAAVTFIVATFVVRHGAPRSAA